MRYIKRSLKEDVTALNVTQDVSTSADPEMCSIVMPRRKTCQNGIKDCCTTYAKQWKHDAPATAPYGLIEQVVQISCDMASMATMTEEPYASVNEEKII